MKEQAQQWSSASLIAHTNMFLDSLELGEGESLRSSLVGAVRKLSELKGQMLFHGFNAPFLSLLAMSRSEFEGMSEAESRDLAKQLDAVRNLANSKKLTLNRARVALTACRMALEALDEGERDFATALPLKGEYLGTLMSKSDLLYPYYAMMGVLERECGKRSKTIFTVKYKIGEKEATARVSISKEKDIEGYVRRVYGEGAKIVDSRVFNVPELLIKKRSSRVCIAIAYSKLAYEMTSPELDRVTGSLREYTEIMRSNGLSPYVRIDTVEDHDEVKRAVEESGLAKTEGGRFSLDERVAYALAVRRKTLRTQSVRNAKKLFALHLFKHFTLKSKRSRDSSSMLPSLNEGHLGLLGDVLETLNAPPYSLENAEGVIKGKMEAERVKPRMDSRLFGASLVFLTTDKSAEWCSEHLGVNAEAVRKAASSIAGLVDSRAEKLAELGLGKRGRRAAEFTELVKHAGGKHKKRPKKR